jgi:ABC-type glycerol-3-phosphate transport system permease component
MVPLGASGLVVVAIFTFLPIWGEYLQAYTFLTSPAKMPLALGILGLRGSFGQGEWTMPVGAACVFLTFIPVLLIYSTMQRWFAKGLLEGALKF